MLLKSIEDLLAFKANDNTTLREVIHPKNDNVQLNYSLAHASLGSGESSLPHCLVNQSELYVFLEGEGKININGDERNIKKGDVVLVPKGATQYVENRGKGTLKFLCIVSPLWQENDDLVV